MKTCPLRLSHIAAAALAACVCGCVTVDRDAKHAIEALERGEDAKAVAWGNDLADESHYS